MNDEPLTFAILDLLPVCVNAACDRLQWCDTCQTSARAILVLIKQEREHIRLHAQFELCYDLINKNHDGTQINWNDLGADVANKKIELLQKLRSIEGKPDHE